MVSDDWRMDWLRANMSFSKRVFIPSPELHGRQKMEFWRTLREEGVGKRPNVVLCTDHPIEAREFFDGRAL
jgi:hypothetical protein